MTTIPSNSNLADDESLQVNYARWFWRVAGWDVVLPIVIFVAPLVGELILGKHDQNCGIYVVFVAIPALFIRVLRGFAAIQTNTCGAVMRFFQGLFLICVAITMLLADTMALAMHDINPASLTLVIGTITSMACLPFMIFAMYPGVERQSLEDSSRICGRCGAPIGSQSVYVCRACQRDLAK